MRVRVIAATLMSLTGCATSGTLAAGSSERGPLTVAEAASLKPEGQSLWVQGYVVTLYRCPPCPEGAQCEQCLNDHVVLSDAQETVEGDAHAAERRDWLFLEPGQQDLTVGQQYRFFVKWREEPSERGEPATVGYVLAALPVAR
jgi:hypothetical protein